ncbi:hypothetical protein C2845_PM17G14470 [Panicum miliaceum]|uniref:F-box domain-containing protein n=1 Tax=Panicum miliaceum TaxID=4540 RepID=A0A3L6Q6B5_PANMI|nr:hypothetical protein C2845_PM17G14470 [Panicum miliaceum]
METAAALPGDVLAAVLGRLPAHSLAASRCVCQAWRRLADERRLLLPHLLPHSVRGFFVNYVDPPPPPTHFFARPAAAPGPWIDGAFSFVDPEHRRFGGRCCNVADHCNGLVLLQDELLHTELYACNPTTRRWVRLPRLAAAGRAFLVFDPAVSRHYEVLVAPVDPPAAAGIKVSMEWPPSRCTWQVFSSRTRRWRPRVFVREGEAAGVAADMAMGSLPYVKEAQWRYGVYWQGALYVHCRGEYVSRMSLSNGKYKVIKSPVDRAECYNKTRSFIGRSGNGVCFASIYACRLRVWILSECRDQTEWTLKHDRDLEPDDWWEVVVKGDHQQIKYTGPWILDDYYDSRKAKRNVDWSSDDDDIICGAEGKKKGDGRSMYPPSFHFLGFHPFKEVIFLTALGVAVAYHWNTSRVQFMGILKPNCHNYGVYDSFVYTPCIRPA